MVARRPWVAATALGWALRLGRRVGLSGLRAGRPRGMTFVVHAFMDAAVVRRAWQGMEDGIECDDPDGRAAQERLRACSYAMAHPDDGRLVPACVQHGVLDQDENRRLLVQLPMSRG